ncbi:MAG: DUF1883 domain-containing protein [Endomicrobium sp.]|jgi:hypothetical protein|nr:DUF1883 domain-containing protein [Endomicrobium sp.]
MAKDREGFYVYTNPKTMLKDISNPNPSRKSYIEKEVNRQLPAFRRPVNPMGLPEGISLELALRRAVDKSSPYYKRLADQYTQKIADEDKFFGRENERNELRNKLREKIEKAPLQLKAPLDNQYWRLMQTYINPNKDNSDINFNSLRARNFGSEDFLNDVWDREIPQNALKRSGQNQFKQNERDRDIYANGLGTRYNGGLSRKSPLRIKIPTEKKPISFWDRFNI